MLVQGNGLKVLERDRGISSMSLLTGFIDNAFGFILLVFS